MNLRLSKIFFVIWCWLGLSTMALVFGLTSQILEEPNAPTIRTCDDLRRINRKLEGMSQEELKFYIYTQFRDSTKSRQREAYILSKYYDCRFPDDQDEFASYMKSWVKKYEKGMIGFYLRQAFYW